MSIVFLHSVVIYSVINFARGIGATCNIHENCFWSVKEGFQLKGPATLPGGICSDETYCGSTGEGDDVFVLENVAKGSMYSEWITETSDNNDLCISAQIYIKNVTVSVELTVGVESGGQESTVANVTNSYGWQDVHLKYTKPDSKYRLTLDISASDSNVFVIISSLNVTSSCPLDEEITCSTQENFSCDDNECVPWSVVCDLKQDCTNGRDEQICDKVASKSFYIADSLPQSAVCTFENGTCGWRTVEHTKNFKWILTQGPTPTVGTGPTEDHTTQTEEGHYIYVDGRQGGMFDRATLQSLIMPAFDEKIQSKCKLRFFYHKIGRDVGKLNVEQFSACPVVHRSKLLWSHDPHDHGTRDDKWHFAEISLAGILSRYFIHIDGYGAMLNHGDIAVDDISFSPECFGYSYKGNSFVPSVLEKRPVTAQEFSNNTDYYCETQTDKAEDTEMPENQERIQEKTESSSVTEATVVRTMNQDSAEKMSAVYIVAITLAGIAVAIVMGAALLCLALRRRKDNSSHSARLEMVSTVSDDHCNNLPVQSSSIDMQLRCAVTELNPNYDFITAKFPEQQLREIPRSKLNLIRLLGQGAFGEVYEGRLKNLCANVSELPVAVKTLPALSTEQAETDFFMEAVIISKFMHKNVVKCLGVCFEEHPRYIILELLEGGDLRSFLRDSRSTAEHKCTLTMEDLIKLAIDISNGCRHLEEKHFVHRDIAARNCLLTTRGPGRIAKIADFGMSRDIYSSDYYRKGGKAMLPIKWMPPEAFLDGVFTSKTDTWSYGVLLWEIFTLGYMPYPGQTNSDVMHFVASGGRLDPPEKCPARLSKIMIMCWNSVADIRPSFSEIGELLDMCLQDEEVLNSDVSLCHYPITECFKDASTLAKATGSVDKSSDTSVESQTEGASGTAAEFKGHFESQSREPLLLSSPDS